MLLKRAWNRQGLLRSMLKADVSAAETVAMYDLLKQRLNGPLLSVFGQRIVALSLLIAGVWMSYQATDAKTGTVAVAFACLFAGLNALFDAEKRARG